MMTKKNKILFFILSVIPGAAHMYIGLMKRGLVLMALFVADIGLSTLVPVFLVLLPVMWFYCFFDAWNKYSLSEEELKKVDDSFIFFFNAIPDEILPKSQRFSKKIPQRIYKIGGIACICFGVYVFWDQFITRLLYNMPDYAAIVVFREISSYLPQVVIAVLLIVVGVKLIAHKKKEIEFEDRVESKDEYIDIYSNSEDIESKK